MKTPAAPDPMQTAAAQSGMNRDSAISQQLINMTNQRNPWGSVDYNQGGQTSYVDSSGRTVSIPQFTQTTTFSPEQQEIFNRTQAAETNIAGLARDQSGMLQEYLAKPFEYTNKDAENWSFDLASQRLIPEQERQNEALRTRLINSGLRPGSDAYGSEMTRKGRLDMGQLNDLAFSGRQQGFSEALATRNAPINEITALLSGSQVSNPAQMSGPTPQASVGGVDYSGLVQQQYQNQMQSRGGMMGGLFGLAGQGVGAAMKFSDERLKEDIEPVGKLDNGEAVYSYRYKAGGPVEIGLLAQEVEKRDPGAVHNVGGFKAVQYDRAVR